MKCPNGKQGCLWQGELGTLGKHLDPVHGDCTADIPCKYGCGRSFTVSSLDDHYRTCDKRPYTCEHCRKFSSMYVRVKKFHYDECPMYPVPCANGCLAMIPRQDVQKHNSKCRLAVNCRYGFAGCTTKLGQSAMEQHLQENTAQHLGMVEEAYRRLTLACDRDADKYREEVRSKDQEIRRLQDKLERSNQHSKTLEREVKSLENEMEELEEYDDSDSDNFPTTLPKQLVLNDFYDLQESEEKWYSPPFYVEGYKLCLSAYPNGVGAGKHSHLSVFVNVMQGEYDDDLLWPFEGAVAVQLQDRSGSKLHFRRVISFDANSAGSRGKRVTSKPLNPFGHGDPCFFGLADLQPYFLLGDALFFMVLAV